MYNTPVHNSKNMNQTISYAKARQNLKHSFDKVCEENVTLLVERRNGENVVIISEEDFLALEETAYLLRSPKNAKRLLESLEETKSKRTTFNNVNELADAIGI